MYVCMYVLRGADQSDQPVRVHVPQRPLCAAVVVPRRLPRNQPLPGHGSGRPGTYPYAHINIARYYYHQEYYYCVLSRVFVRSGFIYCDCSGTAQATAQMQLVVR